MSSNALTYWQAGLESTPGTPVAATRRLYEVGGVPEEVHTKMYVGQSRGNYVANFDVLDTATSAPFSLEAKALSFKDLAWWAELFFKGGVTPTGAGPYVRTYNGMGTSDSLKAATFEVADDIGAFQIPFAFGKSIEIKGKVGAKPGPISAKYDLMGQYIWSGHTMTAALPERDLAGTYMLANQAELYINNSAALIGVNAIGSLMEFSIKMDTNSEAIYFGGDEGRYAAKKRGERYLEVMVKLEFDNTAYGEFGNYFSATSARFCQLKITDGTANNIAAFNFHTKWDKFTWPEEGPTRQVSLIGRSVYDPTLGYDWQLTLTNQLASIS